MELLELKKELAAGKVRGFYVFYGEEYYVLSEYIQRVVRASGKKLCPIDNIGAVSRHLNNKNIFNQGYVYLCSEDKSLLTQESLWATLRQNKGEHIIIVKYESLDKRNKFYKENSTCCVEFEKIGSVFMKKQAMAEFGLNEQNADRLVNRCNENYGLMVLHGKKVSMLSAVLNVGADRAFELCVKDDLIPITFTNLGIDFVDAVMYKDYKKVFFYKQILQDSEDSVLQILSLLYTSIRNVFLVQSYKRNEDAVEKTGLSGGLVQACRDKCGIYSLETLKDGLGLLRDTEMGLKNGTLTEDNALDDFLVNFLLIEA